MSVQEMSKSSASRHAQLERERAAAERAAAAERKRQETEKRRRESEKKRQDSLTRHAYLEGRRKQAEALNVELASRIREIETVLPNALTGEPRTVDFQLLKRALEVQSFDAQGNDRREPEPRLETFTPREPSALAKLLPWVKRRYEQQLAIGQDAFHVALEAHASSEDVRKQRLTLLESQHKADCQRLRDDILKHNFEIDAFKGKYEAGDVAAVARYFEIVLQTDNLPQGFPQNTRVAYDQSSKQLLVEAEAPTSDIVPTIAAYKYVASADRIETSSRPLSQVRSLYNSLFAQFALRSLYRIFASNTSRFVDIVVLNCFVTTLDPSTGKQIRPCLLSVQVVADAFSQLDLAGVNPTACLKGLNAQVSRSPHELVPVRPLKEFDMVDARFIEGADVLSQLDTRPNLAELSPAEFEALITNLFQKMGLETKLTQASRDGGVDCVAWDMRPVVGGKVIVQAKRYKHTVGVSAVRDLYGTVHNEGAAKGILVSTSGYGKAAFQFAENKPLELITGSNLLYLLEEHTGIRAKINFPDDWQDPIENWER